MIKINLLSPPYCKTNHKLLHNINNLTMNGYLPIDFSMIIIYLTCKEFMPNVDKEIFFECNK